MRRRYSYDWPRPGVTVDVALFTVTGALNELRLQVVLIERRDPPFAGQWALPGGFVRENEDLHAAALRELREETGIRGATVERLAEDRLGQRLQLAQGELRRQQLEADRRLGQATAQVLERPL